jgi:hypothetical protein
LTDFRLERLRPFVTALRCRSLWRHPVAGLLPDGFGRWLDQAQGAAGPASDTVTGFGREVKESPGDGDRAQPE